MKVGAATINFLSGEWMLNRGRPNGGDVVVYRTLWIGTLLIVSIALLRSVNFISEGFMPFVQASLLSLKTSTASSEGPTIFGAAYAALYARFTSQWTYIANLYNQIKQAELEAACATSSSATVSPSAATSVLAQWKAGFIEDALAVHMASKPMIKGVIQAWFADPDVKGAFMKHAPHAEDKVWQLLHFKVLRIPVP
jgi:hypothetical protein